MIKKRDGDLVETKYFENKTGIKSLEERAVPLLLTFGDELAFLGGFLGFFISGILIEVGQHFGFHSNKKDFKESQKIKS